MDEEKLISVIVPAYNVEKYIKECLESLKNQTYRNLEIFVINDCSTDSTGEIILEQAKLDDRIRNINLEKNIGLSAVRNLGIELSHGDYLSFIDSDDLLDCNFYKVLLKTINKDSNIDIAQCALKKFHSVPYRGKTISEFKDFVIEYPIHKTDLIRKDPVTFVMQSNKLFKRKIFDTLRYPEGKVHEDVYVIYDEYALANKVAYANKTNYYYRIGRSDSITGTLTLKRMNDSMFAYDHMSERLLEDGDIEFYLYIRKKQIEDFMYMFSFLKQKDLNTFEHIKDIYFTNAEKYSFESKRKFNFFFAYPTFMGFLLKIKAKAKEFL